MKNKIYHFESQISASTVALLLEYCIENNSDISSNIYKVLKRVES